MTRRTIYSAVCHIFRFHTEAYPLSPFCKPFWLLSIRSVRLSFVCLMFPLPRTYVLNTESRTHLLCIDHSKKNTQNDFHWSRKRPFRDREPLLILFQKWTGFSLNRNSSKRTTAVLTCLQTCGVRKKRGLWLPQDASNLNVTNPFQNTAPRWSLTARGARSVSDQCFQNSPLGIGHCHRHWCQMKKRVKPDQNKSKGHFSSRENLIIRRVKHTQAAWKVPLFLQRQANGSALKVP